MVVVVVVVAMALLLQQQLLLLPQFCCSLLFFETPEMSLSSCGVKSRCGIGPLFLHIDLLCVCVLQLLLLSEPVGAGCLPVAVRTLLTAVQSGHT